MDISDIHDVRKGWKTDIFNRIASKVEKRVVKMPNSPPLVDEKNCFSIIIGELDTSLPIASGLSFILVLKFLLRKYPIRMTNVFLIHLKCLIYAQMHIVGHIACIVMQFSSSSHVREC